MLRWKSLLSKRPLAEQLFEGGLPKAPRRKPRPAKPHARRLRAELLEDRRLLAVFTVTNLDNAGPGSLRDAIAMANATGEADEIVFDATVFAAAQTIALDSQLPTITSPLSITGSEAGVTIDAGGGTNGVVGNGDGFRIFNFDDGTEVEIAVEIRGLTLTGGDASDDGGAIFNLERLTVTRSTLSGNSARIGGGIYNRGTAAINQSTLSANSANEGGGGIFSFLGTTTITQSTLSGNSAPDSRGGGVFHLGGTATITQSIISGNTAGFGGAELGGGFGTVYLDGFNLIGDRAKTTDQALYGVAAGGSDILATIDGNIPTEIGAILAPLADNGGPD